MKYETLRNALANFAGGLLPAVVMLFTTPFVINSLGEEGYGLLTLVTAIVGYFAFLDLNVTAGSVKYVAEYQATGDIIRRNKMLTSGVLLYLVIGFVGCALVLLLSDLLLDSVFEIDRKIRSEAKVALILAAFGFLFGQMQTYLNSIPQSLRRYDKSALLEIVFGVVTPLSTVVVLLLGYGLVEIVAVRVLISIVNNLLLVSLIRRLLPDFEIIWPDRNTLLILGRFSGFAYLSRLASLAYAQGDKLILGALTNVTALTYYSVPFMLVNRVFALTYRLGGVMFPVASALLAQQDTDRLKEIYLYGARYVFFINCTLSFLMITLAYDLLYYWVGPVLAENGAGVLLLITVASLAESLTNAPSLVNDGLGKPRVTGSFAISRAIIGVFFTFVLVERMGFVGAAWAQVGTACVMAALFLFYVHGRIVPVSLRSYLTTVVLPSAPLLLGVFLFKFQGDFGSPKTILETMSFLCIESVFALAYGLVFVFRPSDRDALFRRFRHRGVEA